VGIDDGLLRVVIMIVLFDLQTPEVFELSKEIKEKLKEADKYGIVITFNFDNM
jgi:L-asparaginase/Glu-tRNA(Gln) amidotransferase subunit D